mgnify:CR=1 FL=1
MSYIKLPDSFIHPRSNQPAKGHAGRMAEVKFFHIFKEYIDKDVRWATRDENIYKKFDIASSIKDYGKMDIKAEKDALSDGTVWIEYQNGDGKPGWIYGEADYIVFDLYWKYVAIDRIWLQLITDKLTKGKVYTEQFQVYNKYVYKSQALYNPYRRKGRKDILTKIKTEDVLDRMSWSIPIPKEFHTQDYRTNS